MLVAAGVDVGGSGGAVISVATARAAILSPLLLLR